MQFLRKWHLQEALKSRSSIGNFLGEVVGKDEIGPKPYGTIAGVTLPGFLSISYISFPLRTHSNPPPSDLNWCKKVKSGLHCSKRGTSRDERSSWLSRHSSRTFQSANAPISDIPCHQIFLLEIPYVGHRISENIPPSQIFVYFQYLLYF